MNHQKITFLVSISVVNMIVVFAQRNTNVNPSIIQDSRDLPNTNGAFGFLYRTEDGIAHGAVGDENGVVHGRYTYTDPTGLKVNFNYNAGSRNTPSDYKKNSQSAPSNYRSVQPQPQQRPQAQRPQPLYREDVQQEEYESEVQENYPSRRS